jgi:tripartite-type tricarboxylate transporter receptor subunit TctC
MSIHLTRRSVCIAFAAGCILASAATAQSLPQKPVRAVLPYSAGSGPDNVVRHVGDKLSKLWGQPVLIDNKPGGNGWIAIGDAKRAPADGSTLLVVDNTHFTLQQHLYKQMPFSATADFEPVAGLYFTHFFIVVAADSPWNSVGDMVAAARKKSLTYGTWGVGSVAHIGSAMLQDSTRSEMLHVPYKELPQLYIAVANKDVDWAFGTAATVAQLYRARSWQWGTATTAGRSRNSSRWHGPIIARLP